MHGIVRLMHILWFKEFEKNSKEFEKNSVNHNIYFKKA